MFSFLCPCSGTTFYWGGKVWSPGRAGRQKFDPLGSRHSDLVFTWKKKKDVFVVTGKAAVYRTKLPRKSSQAYNYLYYVCELVLIYIFARSYDLIYRNSPKGRVRDSINWQKLTFWKCQSDVHRTRQLSEGGGSSLSADRNRNLRFGRDPASFDTKSESRKKWIFFYHCCATFHLNSVILQVQALPLKEG